MPTISDDIPVRCVRRLEGETELMIPDGQHEAVNKTGAKARRVTRLKNLQSAARRRGFKLHRKQDSFVMIGNGGRIVFEDLDEVRDELREHEVIV